MQGKKPKLKRKEIKNMWHVYWKYKNAGTRNGVVQRVPPKESEDYGLYMYADYLLRTERYTRV